MDKNVELKELTVEQASCGRVNFREADLAYLLIDKERMFPLAELLASLFRNTARTTLFTRMEKINTRRHFCNAEEIKLLKTVNGIHGSSAICTLIPEADVQKYCGVYVDRTIDLKQFAKGKRTRKLTAKSKGNCKSKVSGFSKSTTTVNSDEETDQTVKNSIDDNVNIINSLKRKNRLTSSKRRVNSEAKVKVLREDENKLSDNESQLLGEVFGSEDSHSPSLSEHVTNCTQTVSLLSEPVVKPRKKRKAKDCVRNDCKDHIEQNKRPRKTDEIVSTFYPPSNASLENGIVNSDGNCAVNCSASTVSLENANSSCLSQCLTNANSEILFSDSSSNDSGFGSTTLSLASTCKLTSSSSTPKPDMPNKKLTVTKKIKLTLPSPTKLKKNQGPKKIKLQQGFDCKNMSKLVDPSLSPPALVIKRQNNTWQVKTKTEVDSKAQTSRKIPKTAKKKLKWSSSESLKAQTLHLQNAISNGQNVLNNKKRLKKVISDKVNGTLNVESRRNVVKKKRMRRKHKDVDKLIISTSNSITPSVDSQTITYLGNKKKGLKRKSGTKEAKSPEKNRTSSQTSEKIKGAQSSKFDIAMATSTTPLHSSLNSVCRKDNGAGKTLKANKHFKFMSLFTGFPFLGIQDGDLSPTFSMSVPDNIKKPSSHPIWKWHLGRPVQNHESKRKANVS